MRRRRRRRGGVAGVGAGRRRLDRGVERSAVGLGDGVGAAGTLRSGARSAGLGVLVAVRPGPRRSAGRAPPRGGPAGPWRRRPDRAHVPDPRRAATPTRMTAPSGRLRPSGSSSTVPSTSETSTLTGRDELRRGGRGAMGPTRTHSDHGAATATPASVSRHARPRAPRGRGGGSGGGRRLRRRRAAAPRGRRRTRGRAAGRARGRLLEAAAHVVAHDPSSARSPGAGRAWPGGRRPPSSPWTCPGRAAASSGVRPAR